MKPTKINTFEIPSILKSQNKQGSESLKYIMKDNGEISYSKSMVKAERFCTTGKGKDYYLARCPFCGDDCSIEISSVENNAVPRSVCNHFEELNFDWGPSLVFKRKVKID